eukprot:scaffold212256_cov20-Tisochrysis_lutea.AAC.1
MEGLERQYRGSTIKCENGWLEEAVHVSYRVKSSPSRMLVQMDNLFFKNVLCDNDHHVSHMGMIAMPSNHPRRSGQPM